MDNKVGSHLLALAAGGVPVYALADVGKVSAGGLAALVHPVLPMGASGELEEKCADEVTATWPDGAQGCVATSVSPLLQR